jgi:hypothetical protein
VQGNYADPQSPQTTVNATFSAAQTAGDLNIVVVGWGGSTATVTSVTDTRGNTYKLAVGPTILAGVATQSIYYAANIAASAAGNIVTVAFSGAAPYPDIRILEYQGADPNNPVDVTAASSGNSATSSSGPATTTNATDLIFGANYVQNATTGPGSGFTSRLLTSPDSDIALDQMVSTMGSYTATAQLNAVQGWVMHMVALRTPGSAPPAFDFSLANGGNQIVVQGQSVSNTITATRLSGTAQSVAFSASGLPAGATAAFSPGSCSPTCSSTLTLTTSSSTPTGSWTITVTGVAGSLSRTTTFTLTVNAPSPSFDFSLSNGGNKAVVQGQSVTNTITATLVSGTAQSVSFSASGLPSGATAAFSPGSCNPTCSSTMTVTASSSTPTGSSTITVTGVAGSLSHTTTFTLTVNGPPPPPPSFDFSLSNGGNSTVVQGQSVTNTITATLVSGTAQSVSFSASGLPTGTSAAFSPGSCSPTCSSTLTLTTSSSTPAGSSTITVTGVAGSLSHTTTFTLIVNGTAPAPTKWTGSGRIDLGGGATGYFGFYIVRDSTGAVSGELEYYDDTNSLDFDAQTNLAITVNGNQATITGTGQERTGEGAWSSPYNFTATVQAGAQSVGKFQVSISDPGATTGGSTTTPINYGKINKYY